MKIYSMTATFGKLDHATLELKPGLNVIHAPNEWGKSTWCAFLAAMLYGIDTRERSKQGSLADKEHYAPWSGSPMSGRMNIRWKDRDITIERRTKGRSVMGDFKAYETESGLPVPELSAANCGQMLLGVEKEVFLRAGFLRLTDLPVTQDEALRRRLNALVTTGDESGAADKLGQKLRDLKNRCRFNRTGLLPQAEARRAELIRKIGDLESHREQSVRISQRQKELENHIAKLENHKATLAYEAAQENAGRVEQAVLAKDRAYSELERLEGQCAQLPDQRRLEQQLKALEELQQSWEALQMDSQLLPQQPIQPEAPGVFRGMSPAEAVKTVENDTIRYRSGSKAPLPLLILSVLGIVGAVVLLALSQGWLAIIPGVVAVLALSIGLGISGKDRRQRQEIARKYGSEAPEDWRYLAQKYEQDWRRYGEELTSYRKTAEEMHSRRNELVGKIREATGGRLPKQAVAELREKIALWDRRGDAAREYQRLTGHAQTLQAMTKPVDPPRYPDELTWSAQETARLLADAQYEQRQLQMQLGQSMGQMAGLGAEESLRQELEQVNRRIRELEDMYAALTTAQETLNKAAAELQRRFAPKIADRARELFTGLTGHRYDRLTMAQDMSLQIGAQGEDTLRDSLWRSDGTVDQLYLALRLAVAEELTPEAPLVLDDALVRFDDIRLERAMEILKTAAQNKQVILFTCQGRETQYE